MSKHKYVYALRTCAADLKSSAPEARGFQWPSSGIVKAPDWDPKPMCGYGLHGLLAGEGEAEHLSQAVDAKWLVVKVRSDLIVDLGGKIKFPRCRVVYCGDRQGATTFLAKRCPNAAIHYGTATAGYGGTATAGYGGTAKAGEGGTATAGYGGTATAGDRGTAKAGEGGTATAGYGGTATAGSYGTATAGEGGTATAGNRGTATAGNRGTATAGYGGTATAGEGGILILNYLKGRTRLVVGYVGEGGIKPNTKYKLNDSYEFEEVP